MDANANRFNESGEMPNEVPNDNSKKVSRKSKSSENPKATSKKGSKTYIQLTAELKQSRSQIRVQKEEIERLKQELKQANDEIELLNKELKASRNLVMEVTASAESLREENEVLRKNVKRLETERAVIEAVTDMVRKIKEEQQLLIEQPAFDDYRGLAEAVVDQMMLIYDPDILPGFRNLFTTALACPSNEIDIRSISTSCTASLFVQIGDKEGVEREDYKFSLSDGNRFVDFELVVTTLNPD